MDGARLEIQDSGERALKFDAYAVAIAAGLKEGTGRDCGVNKWQSDLYIVCGPIGNWITAFYKHFNRKHVPPSRFRENMGTRFWWEFSFGYTPFWVRCGDAPPNQDDAAFFARMILDAIEKGETTIKIMPPTIETTPFGSDPRPGPP